MPKSITNSYITLKIRKVETENQRVKNFVLNGKVDAMPGQYVMVWIPRLNEKPFGVVNKNPMTLSIAKVGLFTEKIHTFKKNDKLSYRGPYGTSFRLKKGKILMVGGGYGVVPLYLLSSSYSAAQRKKITVVIGAKNKKELLFINKFKSLGCQIEITTDDGSSGFRGFSTDLVGKLIEKNRYNAVYTVGPEIMMVKIAQLCLKKKIFCQVSAERYFKCGGMGLCGECSINGFLVCKEGPVVDGPKFLKLIS